MQKETSRRIFLGFLIAFFSEACEFTKKQKGPNGQAEIHLPYGEKRPDTGIYQLLIERKRIQEQKPFLDGFIKSPDIRVVAAFVPKGTKLTVACEVGPAKERPKSTIITYFQTANPNRENLFTMWWKDWIIYKTKLNNEEYELPPEPSMGINYQGLKTPVLQSAK